jgi:hypothetical protein
MISDVVGTRSGFDESIATSVLYSSEDFNDHRLYMEKKVFIKFLSNSMLIKRGCYKLRRTLSQQGVLVPITTTGTAPPSVRGTAEGSVFVTTGRCSVPCRIGAARVTKR